MAENRLTLRFTAQNDATKEFAKVKSDIDKISGAATNLSNLFKATLFAGATVGLVKAMNDAVQAASAVSEAQNKANLVFGDAVGVINQLAATSAQALGQTKAGVLDTAGSLGSFFKNAGLARDAAATMSVSVIKLASDMASFHNTDPTEMLAKIRSGLAGEVEPLRRYGVDLSAASVQQESVRMGLSKIGEDLNQNQKLLAAHSILMRQSSDVSGDFARTSDGLANSQRQVGAAFQNIIANVGSAFLPTIEVLLVKFKKLIFDIEEWTRSMPKNVAIWLMELQIAWIQASAGVASAVNAMAQGVETGFQFIRGAIKSVAEALAGFMSVIGGTGMMSVLPGIGAAAQMAAPALKSFADSVNVTGTSMADLQTKSKWIKDDMGRDILQVIQDTDKTIANLGATASRVGPNLESTFVPPLLKTSGAAKEAKKSLEELLAAALMLDAMMPQIEAMVQAGDLLDAAAALVALGESAESAVGKVISIMQKLRDEATRAAKEAADALVEAAKKAADAWKERSDQMARSIIDALKAGKDWAVGTADFFRNEWLEGLEGRIKEVAQNIRNAMRDGLDISQIVRDAEPLFAAYKKAQADIAAQADAVRKAQEELAEAQRYNAAQSQEWIRQQQLNADFAFQESLRQRKEELDEYSRAIDAEIAKIRAFEESQRSKAAARAAQKLQNAAVAHANERVGGLSGLLGGDNAPDWWVNGLRDALHGLVVKSYLDGKDVSKGVSGRQQQGSQLLAAMGGFA